MIDLYGYVFLGLVFVSLLPRLQVSRTLAALYFGLILASGLAILLFNLPLFPFIKQAVPILFIYFATYHILHVYRWHLTDVFELYVKVAFWTAVFGIGQYWACQFGYCFLIGPTGQLDSIAYEPSHYAVIIMPATIYTLWQFQRYRKEAIVFVLALIFTRSLTSMSILLVAFLLPLFRIKYVPLVGLVLYAAYLILPQVNDKFAMRIYGTERIIRSGDYGLAVTPNGTVNSFASNLDVAFYSVRQSPLFGSGLGGHETMYERKFAGTDFASDYFYGLNQLSAHSLSIRILSELGLIGFAAYVFFLIKSYIKKEEGLTYHLISLACISHFMAKTLKLGGYIDYGTPFFFCLLLINFQQYRAAKKSQQHTDVENHFPLHAPA